MFSAETREMGDMYNELGDTSRNVGLDNQSPFRWVRLVNAAIVACTIFGIVYIFKHCKGCSVTLRRSRWIAAGRPRVNMPGGLQSFLGRAI